MIPFSVSLTSFGPFMNVPPALGHVGHNTIPDSEIGGASPVRFVLVSRCRVSVGRVECDSSGDHIAHGRDDSGGDQLDLQNGPIIVSREHHRQNQYCLTGAPIRTVAAGRCVPDIDNGILQFPKVVARRARLLVLAVHHEERQWLTLVINVNACGALHDACESTFMTILR